METAEKISAAQKALDQGKGILRLTPTWVPRSFCVPGRRIKLHPDDYYVLGGQRGGIDERWLSSTTPAWRGFRSLVRCRVVAAWRRAPVAERQLFAGRPLPVVDH